MADRRERAVRHRLQRRVLGGRSPHRSSASVAPTCAGIRFQHGRRECGPRPRLRQGSTVRLEAWPAVAASGNASSDDLQDLLSLYLDQCKNAGGELYAFGAKFDRNLHKPIDIEFGNTDGLHGIHDIHLNQGNVGAHAGDNGVFHDGGLILAFPDRFVGLFLGFQTQRIPTDANGNAAPGATPIGQIIAGEPIPTPPPPASSVYIERALINPSGDDAGHEIVVLASLVTTSQTLANWRLIDKNGIESVLADLRARGQA